jgi:uncharacterized protein (DUF1778 family)|tara:strand:+ start:15 stop:302 length:288 start_codon:yes stop_codon:yes gene_type:complete
MTPEKKANKTLKLARSLGSSRGGRPKKSESKNRNEVIKLRVSKQEKDILALACQMLNLSYTSLLLDNGVANAKALLNAEGVSYPTDQQTQMGDKK